MNNHTVNISDVVVRDPDGDLDMAETLEAFEAVVLAWEEENNANNETVLTAVNSVYEKNPGKPFSLQALTFEVMKELDASSDVLGTIQGQVNSVIKSNPTVFETTRGKGGGTRKIADKPVVATA